MEAKQMYEGTTKKLREYAEWAESNIYYVPVMLPDDLAAAADAIESLKTENAELREAQRWIAVTPETLPTVETEVMILAETKTGHKVITTAMYEDGKMPNGESIWNWSDIDFNYDEENDEYLIPEGWWEYRHYNPDDVYNNVVDDKVIAWRPLPSPPEGAKE
jgi:hypothetical protein